MKKTSLVFIFFICLIDVFAQNNELKSIPIIVPLKGLTLNKYEYTIYTDCVRDTLKIAVSMAFRFETTILDTTQQMNLKESYIIGLDYVNRFGKKVYLDKGDLRMNSYNQSIWNLCSDTLSYWAEHQHYDQLDYSRIISKSKDFGGNVFIRLIPIKPRSNVSYVKAKTSSKIKKNRHMDFFDRKTLKSLGIQPI